METLQGECALSGRKVGLVVSRWNELITKELLEGAVDELKLLGRPEIVVAKVPGSWEIPLAAKMLIEKRGVDGVAVLGCILQGATTHAAMLANDVSGALMSLQMESGTPITWGILTPENQEQALERSGLKMGNKGREAARSLAEMIGLLRAE